MRWDSCRSKTLKCNEISLHPGTWRQSINVKPKVTSFTNSCPSAPNSVNYIPDIQKSEYKIRNISIPLQSKDVNLGFTDKKCSFKLNPLAKPFMMHNHHTISPINLLVNFETSSPRLSNTDDIDVLDHENVNTISEGNAYTALKELRLKNLNRVIVAHLNINSIRNKIDMLADLISGKVDILLISETKINGSFPPAQFLIPGFSEPYRRDRTENGEHGGGLLLYVSVNIPSKMIQSPCIEGNNESLFVEINLYKKKWIVGGTYNPSKLTTQNHINYLSKCLDSFVS